MKIAFLLLLTAGVSFAASKPQTPGRTGNDNVGIEAKAFLTKEEVKSVVGMDMDQGFIVVEVTLTPRNGETVKVSLDDFLLLSEKDGQKSAPYVPSQIAGAGALIVSTRPGEGTGIMTQQRTIPWGGMGGGRPMGMPDQGGSIGSTTANPEFAKASTTNGAGEKTNPLLATLEKKVLPEKEIKEPLTGQLYFLFEGKHKQKNLELFYKGSGGKLSLKFAR